MELDFQSPLDAVASHPSQCHVQTDAANPNGSWPKVWGAALERGTFGTICSLAMLRSYVQAEVESEMSALSCPLLNC